MAKTEADGSGKNKPARRFVSEHPWTFLIGGVCFLAYFFGDSISQALQAIVGSEIATGKIDSAALVGAAAAGFQALMQRNSKQTGEAVKGVVSDELTLAMLTMQTRQTHHEAAQETRHEKLCQNLGELAESLRQILAENVDCQDERRAHTAIFRKHGHALERIVAAIKRIDPSFEAPDLN